MLTPRNCCSEAFLEARVEGLECRIELCCGFIFDANSDGWARAISVERTALAKSAAPALDLAAERNDFAADFEIESLADFTEADLDAELIKEGFESMLFTLVSSLLSATAGPELGIFLDADLTAETECDGAGAATPFKV